MLLRSLISLLLLLGLANTTNLAVSTSQILASQQVEWYSNGQSSDQATSLFRFNQVQKEIQSVFLVFNQVQANKFNAELCGLIIRCQKQEFGPTFKKAAYRRLIPQYPSEDPFLSYLAS